MRKSGAGSLNCYLLCVHFYNETTQQLTVSLISFTILDTEIGSRNSEILNFHNPNIPHIPNIPIIPYFKVKESIFLIIFSAIILI